MTLGVAALPCLGQTESVLDTFSTSYGSVPFAGLMQASDGNFYGTTSAGGTLAAGTFFKITPAGALTVLHNFNPGTEGYLPGSAVIEGTDGNFYGTLYNGGVNNAGSVFQMTPAGAINILHSFSGPDGNSPYGGLVQGSNGTFYGTTAGGGSSYFGTIFSITFSGTFNSMYQFSGTDAAAPEAGLLEVTPGTFYGTTSGGGTDADGFVYSITSGGTFNVIHSFNGTDGAGAYGLLVEGSDGDFYGTTGYGGADGDGNVFKMTSAGTVTSLYSFTGGNDGFTPYAYLVLGSDGNFYGTTTQGGVDQNGTLFRTTAAGALTTLYAFAGGNDGTSPWAPMAQGSNGNFYGITGAGGSNGDGVLYELTFSPALSAPVQLSLSESQISLGSSTTLTWNVLNAFSTTMQQCAAFVQGGSSQAGAWSGLQTGTLANKIYSGSATLTPTATGTYTYALTCGGQESGFATLTVTSATKSASTTTLTISPNPLTVGQSATLQATVTGAGGTPTGTVSFSADGIGLGSTTLSDGIASITASSAGVPPGSYPVIAKYSGSSTFNASTSSAVKAVVNKAPTVTTMTAQPNPVTRPAACTLTATVARNSGAGVSRGSVAFYYQTIFLGKATLNGSGVGQISAGTSGVPNGTYGVVAKYSGDGSDDASTSSPVNVTVN
jgi:uncharacterized repeat protein (TIGR03803 family)